MLNKVSDGKTVLYTAAADIDAGGLVYVQGKVGIAQSDIPSGAKGVLDMEGGVYRFPIINAGAVTFGAPVYLPPGATESKDGSDLTVTNASGATLIGYNNKAVGTGGCTSLDVRLI